MCVVYFMFNYVFWYRTLVHWVLKRFTNKVGMVWYHDVAYKNTFDRMQ